MVYKLGMDGNAVMGDLAGDSKTEILMYSKTTANVYAIAQFDWNTPAPNPGHPLKQTRQNYNWSRYGSSDVWALTAVPGAGDGGVVVPTGGTPASTGGATGAGGAPGSGGSSGRGGAPGSGGSPIVDTGSGGFPDIGGTTSAGASTAAGGAGGGATGGTPAVGGSIGTGGAITQTGGVPGVGAVQAATENLAVRLALAAPCRPMDPSRARLET
jgi:hypothetical protein